jgi:hypothetical protein
MQLPFSMRLIVVALVLIYVRAVSWAADLKGTMDEGCCYTNFHLRVLHLRTGKDTPGKEIILSLFQGCPGHVPLNMLVSEGWQKVEAKLCDVGSTQCEPATGAKIRLETMSHKGTHASGSYSVDFPSVGHQEGRFSVKQHHEGSPPICE